jgi:hypothetical protein
MLILLLTEYSARRVSLATIIKYLYTALPGFLARSALPLPAGPHWDSELVVLKLTAWWTIDFGAGFLGANCLGITEFLLCWLLRRKFGR